MEILYSHDEHYVSADLYQSEAVPHAFGFSERECLEDLLRQALIDKDIRDRLLVQRDWSLFDAFNLSTEARRWCSSLAPTTLKEFAEAILTAATPRYQRIATPTI